MLEVSRFVQRSDDLCLRFVNSLDSFNACETVVIGRPEDPYEGIDIKGSFYYNMTFLLDPLVGPSSGFRRYLILTYFTQFRVRLLPRTVSLMINAITRCSNITVNYDLCLCS